MLRVARTRLLRAGFAKNTFAEGLCLPPDRNEPRGTGREGYHALRGNQGTRGLHGQGERFAAIQMT